MEAGEQVLGGTADMVGGVVIGMGLAVTGRTGDGEVDEGGSISRRTENTTHMVEVECT